MTPGLTEPETAQLRRLAGLMIPASARYGVPGADDPAIFAEILRSLGRDTPTIRTALAALPADFATLDPPGPAAETWRSSGGEAAELLQRLVLLCYYRDDRVMRALDLEPRPPFPRGFELEQGDWTLLDPVRARPRIWRQA